MKKWILGPKTVIHQRPVKQMDIDKTLGEKTAISTILWQKVLQTAKLSILKWIKEKFHTKQLPRLGFWPYHLQAVCHGLFFSLCGDDPSSLNAWGSGVGGEPQGCRAPSRPQEASGPLLARFPTPAQSQLLCASCPGAPVWVPPLNHRGLWGRTLSSGHAEEMLSGGEIDQDSKSQ